MVPPGLLPGAILNAGAWTSVGIQPAGGTAVTINGAAQPDLNPFSGADNHGQVE